MPTPSWKSTVFDPKRSLFNRPPLRAQLGNLGRGVRRIGVDTAAAAAVKELRATYGAEALVALARHLNDILPAPEAEETTDDRRTRREDRPVPEQAVAPVDAAGNAGGVEPAKD